MLVRSQQLGEGTRTQGLGKQEASGNPLCPANVHHTGKPFIVQLWAREDSFLLPIRPGEKVKAEDNHPKDGASYLQTSVEPSTPRQVFGAEFHVVTGFLPPTPRSLPRHQMLLQIRAHGRAAGSQILQEFSLVKNKSLKRKIVR